MCKVTAIAEHAGFPWLAADDTVGVERVLRDSGLLPADGRVTACAKAGDGNMNLTLRATLAGGETFVVKQSRPWIEKYDAIAAPWDRALVEAAFYRRVAGVEPVAGRMPRLLAVDAAARVLVLEDLGAANDLTTLYNGAALTPVQVRALGEYLRGLHEATCGPPEPVLANRQMRQLNHAHVYVIPLQADNGLDLARVDPSLPDAADELRADADYLDHVAGTGRAYLADGPCLLHGDFFPGSWLSTDVGLRVIDPEFGYYGPAEFDLAVCLAHFALARRPREDAAALRAAYGAAAIDEILLARFAGCEVMRRLIGYAQLPLPPGAWRADLLRASRRCVLAGDMEELWT